MDEKIDIFNDRYEPVGVMSKKEAHRKVGLWHRSFVCLIVNPEKKSVILQSKVKDLYNFERPDYVDFTVGGHYQAGESIADGIRELKEEVGIDANFCDLIPIGIRQTAHSITESYIEYEFQHIFLYQTTQKLSEYTLDTSELDGLVEIDIQDGINLLLGKTDFIEASAVTLIEEKMVKKVFSLSINEFVPSYLEKDKIFVRLFIAAKRLIEGEPVDEIFV